MIKLFKKLDCTSTKEKQRDLNLLFAIFDNSVCTEHLLAFLHVNDLLRLRRVCKFSKNVVEDFVRTQKVKTVKEFKFTVIEDEVDNAVDYSMKCRDGYNSLPMPTHVHFTKLTDNDQSFFNRVSMRNFIDNCGSNITHLSLGYLQVRVNSHRRLLEFFGSFPNVTHLVLENLGPCDVDEDGYISVGIESQFPIAITIPPSLKNLRVLRIQESWHSENTFSFVVKLFEVCSSNLERLSLPFEQFLQGEMQKEQVVRWACTILFNAHPFKLEYLNGEFLQKLLRTDEDRTPEMGTLNAMIGSIKSKVVSIKSPKTTSNLQMIHDLEEIHFQQSALGSLASLKNLRTNWPSLKKISVSFGSRRFWSHGVWEFLFGGDIRTENDFYVDWGMRSKQDALDNGGRARENVTMLDIKFEERPLFSEIRGNEHDEEMYKTLDVKGACPNLKVLHFESQSYDSVILLSRLWDGLPLLEEILFKGCKALSDYDFMEPQGIFYDDETPSFLKLKNLRVLEFVEMHHVSLTDKLFSEVLSHMPLKKLTFSFKYKVHLITLEGIKSLLTGKFASTIEQLSLENLQLEGVTSEMMKCVESQFRSSNMV